MKPFVKQLIDLGACREALEWAKQFDSMEEVWRLCERGDWMLWLAGRLAGPPDSESRRRLSACAAECAELVLPLYESRYPTDRRPREAIEAAKVGDSAKCANAAYAANAAANAAHAAHAAANAAHAAHAAAYAADAADAVTNAADAAANAAYAAHAAANAAYAAAYAAYAAAYADKATRASTLKRCSDIVRKHYPTCPL